MYREWPFAHLDWCGDVSVCRASGAGAK